MHDIRFIRDYPEAFDAALAKRGLAPLAADITSLDSAVPYQTEIQALQSRRNEASKEIGMRKGKGEDADDLIQEVADIKSQSA